MSRHTPYIVIPQGAFATPSAVLYKVAEGEDPIYHRYAEGKLSNMTELANTLNYREAEKYGELAVAEEKTAPALEDVGIPTPPTAETRLEAVKVAIARADSGKINLVQFKRRVDAAVNSEDMIG